jgi:hypothetical protein
MKSVYLQQSRSNRHPSRHPAGWMKSIPSSSRMDEIRLFTATRAAAAVTVKEESSFPVSGRAVVKGQEESNFP